MELGQIPSIDDHPQNHAETDQRLDLLDIRTEPNHILYVPPAPSRCTMSIGRDIIMPQLIISTELALFD